MPLQKTSIQFFYNTENTVVNSVGVPDHWFAQPGISLILQETAPPATAPEKTLQHVFDASEGETEYLLGEFKHPNTYALATVQYAAATLSFRASTTDLGVYILDKFLHFDMYAIDGTLYTKVAETEEQILTSLGTTQYFSMFNIGTPIDFAGKGIAYKVYAVVKYPPATQQNDQ